MPPQTRQGNQGRSDLALSGPGSLYERAALAQRVEHHCRPERDEPEEEGQRGEDVRHDTQIERGGERGRRDPDVASGVGYHDGLPFRVQDLFPGLVDLRHLARHLRIRLPARHLQHVMPYDIGLRLERERTSYLPVRDAGIVRRDDVLPRDVAVGEADAPDAAGDQYEACDRGERG